MRPKRKDGTSTEASTASSSRNALTSIDANASSASVTAGQASLATLKRSTAILTLKAVTKKNTTNKISQAFTSSKRKRSSDENTEPSAIVKSTGTPSKRQKSTDKGTNKDFTLPLAIIKEPVETEEKVNASILTRTRSGTVPASTTKSTVTCTACFDDFPRSASIICPCKDSYCKPCLRLLFTFATKDESVFPPKCCNTEIPLPTGVLSREERAAFLTASVEFRSIGKRHYCFKCNKFIPPKLVKTTKESARCPMCKVGTCTSCGKEEHTQKGFICPDDAAGKKLLKLMKKEKWSRCGKCMRVVAKAFGCDAMRQVSAGNVNSRELN
ncbi:hypothetical protein BJ508DRAFT_304909 [Ascobolus immersus RN42]|uniref:IBR domain-containing protein n=1 Tax=Ascobolus immersus RN42 TaxID=1160509 RepID=A0A3N4IGA5_ASCIM|nr:hypothetical protein BJ508DRAFT_304909 [Ascobolus immersus RN42]